MINIRPWLNAKHFTSYVNHFKYCSMKLLHFAHRAEAQQFIQHFGVKLDDSLFPSVYIGDDLIILVSNEGLSNTHNKVSYLLGKFNISKVVNLGIAGVLDNNLKLDQIVKVRTSYAYDGHGPKFHSFTTNEQAKIDCISTEQRVLDSEFSKKLRPFAHIIDRELWALASSCQLHKVEFESYKYLSDYAGDQTQCLDIKNRAQEFSQKLLEAYLDAAIEDQVILDLDTPNDFYMTFSQKHHVEKLLAALSIKWEISKEEVLKKVNANEILNLNLRPKEKTIFLIEKLEESLTPLKKVIENKLNESIKSLTACGANVSFDRALEKKEFQIRMNINSDKNVKRLAEALSEFSFSTFENIMDGKFDV